MEGGDLVSLLDDMIWRWDYPTDQRCSEKSGRRLPQSKTLPRMGWSLWLTKAILQFYAF